MIKVRFFRFQFNKRNEKCRGQFTLTFRSVEDLVNFCARMSAVHQDAISSNYGAFHGHQFLSFVDLTEDIGYENELIFYAKYAAILRNKLFSPKFPNVKTCIKI